MEINSVYLNVFIFSFATMSINFILLAAYLLLRNLCILDSEFYIPMLSIIKIDSCLGLGLGDPLFYKYERPI